MDDRSCILFKEGAPEDWQRAGRLLSAVSGRIPAGEALKSCRSGHGFVTRALPTAAAEATAAALTNAGFPAVAFPANQVIRAPRAFNIINADALEEGFNVQTDLHGKMQLLPWAAIRLISLVSLQPKKHQKSDREMWSDKIADADPHHLQLMPEKPDGSEEEPEEWIETFLLEPLLRMRIRRHAFNYDYLGSRREDSSRENFRLLLADLLKLAPSAARVGPIEDILPKLSREKPMAVMLPIRTVAPGDYERMLTALLTRESVVGLPRS